MKKIDWMDVCWVLILLMQTGFLFAAIWQGVIPDDYKWILNALTSASACLLLMAVLRTIRGKPKEEAVDKPQPSGAVAAEMLATGRKTLFWAFTFATGWVGCDLGSEGGSGLLVQAAVLLTLYGVLLLLLKRGKFDWMFRI